MKTNIATLLVSASGVVSVATGHFSYLIVLVPTAIALLLTEAFTVLRIQDDTYSVPVHRMLLAVAPPAVLLWVALVAVVIALLSPTCANAQVLTLPSNAAPVIDPNALHVPKTLPGFGMHTAAKLTFDGHVVELQGLPCAVFVAGGPWYAFFEWRGESQVTPQGCWKAAGGAVELVWTLGHEPGVQRVAATSGALRFNPRPEYWGEGHDPANVAAQASLREAIGAAALDDNWRAARSKQLGQ